MYMTRNQSQVSDLYPLTTDKKCDISNFSIALSTKKFRSKYRKITTTQKIYVFKNLQM